MVVSVKEKAGARLSGMDHGDEITEPLMRCRKISCCQNWDFPSQDKFGGRPVYCPSGVRHKGGVNMIQAFVWNVGTCRSDAKGEIQVETPQG